MPRTISTSATNIQQQRMRPSPWLPPPPSESYDGCGFDDLSSNYSGYFPQLNYSDGMNSPVYHSPFPEEHRQYYDLNEPNLQQHMKPNVAQLQSTSQHPGANYHQQNTLKLTDHSLAAGNLGASSRAQSLPQEEGYSPSHGTHGATLHGCGGHCIAFENFCYYCLQISFVVGILAGVSLCIAGGVLRRSHRGGDLLVLVYIGALAAMVCALLLAVQCCVRRQVKARKRALQRPRAPGHVGTMNHGQQIPMSTLQRAAAPTQHAATQNQHGYHGQQLQPLLAQLVQQQTNQTHSHTTISTRDPLPLPHRSQMTSSKTAGSSLLPVHNFQRSGDPYRSSRQRPTEDHSGIPWWRREELKETRH